MEELFSNIESFLSYIDVHLFVIGKSKVTLIGLIICITLLGITYICSRILKSFLQNKVLSRTNFDLGARETISTLVHYSVFTLGFIIILQSVGIDLTALNVLAGALGVGIGFGLQNIANNFISGLIIRFQRPIKLGDRIEVGDVSGKVIQIGSRGTSVLTNDNIAIIVPNSDFMNKNVINWSYGDEKVRFRIPVNVSYNSDIKKVTEILLEVAKENEGVLQTPKSKVCFRGFGDSSLKLELWIWTERFIHQKGFFTSEINYAIFDKFKKNHIQIPFPQRVVHMEKEEFG